MAQTADGEKQFEPTQTRLERAKREGNVVRSPELAGAVTFGLATLALCCTLGGLSSLVRSLLLASIAQPLEKQLGAPVAWYALVGIGALVLAPALAAACAAVGVSLLQSGGLRLTPVSFRFEKLNPTAGLARMISRDTLAAGLRAAVAFGCGTFVLVPALQFSFVSSLGRSNPAGLATLVWSSTLRVIFGACGVGLLFGGLDFGLELSRWKKKLRMSFDEFKRDRKEHDGDPIARGRRRAIHRSFTTGSLFKIKDVAFVITNPTHIAIGLQYDPPHVAVPRVLIRSADETAVRVRTLALAHAIPVVENVALARTLYAACDAGHVIPHQTYVAVAQIVAALSSAGALP